MPVRADITPCRFCPVRPESIFQGLTEKEMLEVDQIKTCQFFRKGDTVFTAGTYPRGLFCVQSGKIKVTQRGADGREQIVHLIHDGDVMGHRAIFGEDTFSCSAVAMEDAHICFLPKDALYRMVEQNPKLALRFAHLLADELKEAEHRITQTAQRPVRDRVAEALLTLSDHYGLDSDGQTLKLTVKREELANLAGTTRETATRMLYALQTEGLIELQGKRIRLLDMDGLSEQAHSGE
jgi:CRP-like cAMP-binding protein